MVDLDAALVDIKRLKKLYEQNSCAKALLDYCASRVKNSGESKVDRLHWKLNDDGKNNQFSRRDLVGVLRQLEELRAGTFIIGRRGGASRFQWKVSMIGLGKAARGEVKEIELLDESLVSVEDEEGNSQDPPQEGVAEVSDGVIRHPYQLRPRLRVTIDLPEDLTAAEAGRLADFIRTLPFDSAIG